MALGFSWRIVHSSWSSLVTKTTWVSFSPTPPMPGTKEQREGPCGHVRALT